jgi:hypothetical protein
MSDKQRCAVAVERDEHGRFKKGSVANPGGRSHEQVARIAALQNAVSDADITAIMEKAVRKACRGDVRAMEFVFDRLFGKAAQAIRLGDSEGRPFFTIRQVIVERAAPPGQD